MKFFSALVVLCTIGSATAFAPIYQPSRGRTTTQLAAAASPAEVAVRKLGGSLLAAATILSNVAIAPQDVYAFDMGETTQVIAARSGGRAGGRAPARVAPSPSKPRVIERQTTIIQQPAYGGGSAMMMAPPMMAPPMYASPAPSGLGLALGINAVSGIASGFREARQENEIRSTRDQLTEARIKEAEMEARLKMLEQQQYRGGGAVVQQQPIQYAAPVQYAQPAAAP